MREREERLRHKRREGDKEGGRQGGREEEIENGRKVEGTDVGSEHVEREVRRVRQDRSKKEERLQQEEERRLEESSVRNTERDRSFSPQWYFSAIGY